MTEAATSSELDTSALSVLLQELVGDLPPQVSDLLKNGGLHHQILQYLHDISSIDTQDYLSSVPPTPGMDVTEERTLVQDIAELEAKQRTIDMKLKSVIVQSQQLIIDNKTELENATNLFTNDFTQNFKSLWRTFNEDDLEDMKAVQDIELQELEADLEPEDKDKTFKAIVSEVKKLIKSDEDENKSKSLSVVLENMEQILNILELPSLTGACIKAGYYSEALEISSYTRRLAIRFPTSELIKEVESGIKSEMSHMLIGLVRLLRTNLKQSSIIKIVSYLRRIQPFSQVKDSDEQLKMILLHARYQFIKSELDSLAPLKESELYEKYLKRSIEVIREHCFGSIMAFKNIFPEINDSELGPVVIEIEEATKPVEEKVQEQPTEPAEESDDDKPTEDEKINDHTEADGRSLPDDGEKEEENLSKEKAEDDKTEATTEDDKQQGKDHEAEEDVPKEKSDSDPAEESRATETVPEKLIVELIKPAADRAPSNLLLFGFVDHILRELSKAIVSSLSQLGESSVRDGLYLQLIYCSHSLGRIDQNFSDLMTATLLNLKTPETDAFLIDRTAWAAAVEKQKQLAKSLLRG